MQVIIAEKPSMGRAIADALGGGSSQSGYIKGAGWVVTWCAGHLMELQDPKEVNPKWAAWKEEGLPIPITKDWPVKCSSNGERQMKVLKSLITNKETKEIVHAGDPGREGQMIVDEILEHLGTSKPVKRILLTSLDAQSIQRAYKNLHDNAEFAAVYAAAKGRALADFSIGINMTRASTIKARKSGAQSILSVGRVQTPTLGLIVARDREIASFKPYDFFTPQIKLRCEPSFTATWLAPEDHDLTDANGRILNKKDAESLIEKCEKSARVEKVEYKEKKQAPTLPFSLSALQTKASKDFGLTAARTLEIAQKLYEQKYTTYPRTDSQYFPNEQFGEAEGILKKLVPVISYAADADATKKSKAWNSQKITEHHAIMPTGQVPSQLTDEEQKIYMAVVQSYVMQFYPEYRYGEQQILLSAGAEHWKYKGKADIDIGWRVVLGGQAKKSSLPSVNDGDFLNILEGGVLSSKTTPPAYFTDGTLIGAMTNVHKYVTDPTTKKRLRDVAGIGTEATRANVLETLIKRGYIARDKGKIKSTDLGQVLIDSMPSALIDPGTTAVWEQQLEDIAKGHKPLGEFIKRQQDALPQMIADVFQNAKFTSAFKGTGYPCPHCGQPMRRLKSKDGKGYYWACFSEAHEKPHFAPDVKGKPAKPKVYPCPKCKEPMRRLKSKDGKGHYWACFSSSHPKPYFAPDVKGKPGQPKRRA